MPFRSALSLRVQERWKQGKQHTEQQDTAVPQTRLGPPLNIFPNNAKENSNRDGALASALFQHIPWDIRYMILIQAWGERIVYLDLEYGLPTNNPRLYPDEANPDSPGSRYRDYVRKRPRKFRVGAMGWLRSCRQA